MNSKLTALNNYSKVATHLFPKDESLSASIMWHGDLHLSNVFVDAEDPTAIVGIIDWQSVALSPLCFAIEHPPLVAFSGTLPDGYAPIELPGNFDDLSPEKQPGAKKLRLAQSLHKLYELDLRRRDEHAFRALQYQDTLQCKLTILVGALFRDGEPWVTGQLMKIEREWAKLVGEAGAPCPLSFSTEDRRAQEADQARWGQGVDLLQGVVDELGAYAGWDGWVSHEDFEDVRARLDACLQRFLSREARTDDERAQWTRVWPFGEEAFTEGGVFRAPRIRNA